jgi:hypothetical protein
MLGKALVLGCAAAALAAGPGLAQKLPLNVGGEGRQCRTAPPGSGEQLCISETGSDVNGVHRESSSNFTATRTRAGLSSEADTPARGDVAADVGAPYADTAAPISPVQQELNRLGLSGTPKP